MKNLITFLISASLLTAASAQAQPPVNPMAKPAQVGMLANPNIAAVPQPIPYPGAQGVNQLPVPGLPMASSAQTLDKTESQAVAGFYVSLVMGKRAVLRMPVAASASAQGGVPSFAPINAAATGAAASGPQQTGSRSIVYKVVDGQTLELVDGVRVKVRVLDDNVALTSLETKHVIFIGSVDSLAPLAPFNPQETALIKPDIKYARSAFIKPLSTPASGTQSAPANGVAQ